MPISMPRCNAEHLSDTVWTKLWHVPLRSALSRAARARTSPMGRHGRRYHRQQRAFRDDVNLESDLRHTWAGCKRLLHWGAPPPRPAVPPIGMPSVRSRDLEIGRPQTSDAPLGGGAGNGPGRGTGRRPAVQPGTFCNGYKISGYASR